MTTRGNPSVDPIGLLKDEPAIAVLCPCCHEGLYSHEPHDKGQIGPDSPPIRSDAEGHYLKCPHCSTRIDVEENGLPGGAFKLSPHQKCERKVP
jgi:uncharacterized protein YlaI